jgi:hypothetical protein
MGRSLSRLVIATAINVRPRSSIIGSAEANRLRAAARTIGVWAVEYGNVCERVARE